MTLAVDQLHFAYGTRPVLHGVSARAERGRITAVLGPNASGKSTLLRCLIGALKPQRGVASIDGESVRAVSVKQVAHRIAYVSQRSIISAAFTVRQVVALGRYALTPAPARIDEAMAKLDLTDVADRPYWELSVGQQQRVTLARAFVQLEPKGNLILDEPTSAMDLQHMAQCMQLLREIATRGATVVVAMHDLSLAASIADDAWLLDAGRLIASGPTGDVLATDRLRAVFKVQFEWVRDARRRSRLIAHMPATNGADTIDHA